MKSNCIATVSPPIALFDIILSLPRGEQRSRIRSVTYWQATLAILAALSVSMALAEDFKTTNGKEYKDATITRVEGDGIVIRIGEMRVFISGEFRQNLASLSRLFGRKRESQLQVPQTRSPFHPRAQ